MTAQTKRQLLELIADQSEELSACYARERKATEDRAHAERSAAINLEQSCRAGIALRDKFAELQADLQTIARAAGLDVMEATTVGDVVSAVEGLRNQPKETVTVYKQLPFVPTPDTQCSKPDALGHQTNLRKLARALGDVRLKEGPKGVELSVDGAIIGWLEDDGHLGDMVRTLVEFGDAERDGL